MSLRKYIQKIPSGSQGVTISPINEEDIDECVEVCAVVFSKVISYESVKSYIRSSADWSISAKAKYKGKIVGCYILKKSNVKSHEKCAQEDLKRYRSLKGVEGVGLAVLPEYRDLGIGKKLRAYPLDKGFDYIWGMHLKSLHNIDNWVRFGRRIICDTGSMFVTLMDLSSKAKKMTDEINNQSDLNESEFENFHKFQNAGHTCGPTCVQMVLDYFGVGYGQIEDIIELCGCNTKTGTIDTGIKNALDSLGIKNQQNLFHKDEDSAIYYLESILEHGDIFIMRTLTKGIKHWIIVYGKAGKRYLIADPWLGKITYSEPEIIKIWQPRDFDGFVVKR